MITDVRTFSCRFCDKSLPIEMQNGALYSMLGLCAENNIPHGWSWVGSLLCCDGHRVVVLPLEEK